MELGSDSNRDQAKVYQTRLDSKCQMKIYERVIMK